MRASRHLLVAGVFIGLIALEVAHGLSRMQAAKQAQRRDLLAAVERGHEALALNVASSLEETREHAAYLARSRGVRELVGSSPESRRRLRDDLSAYLLAFSGIDRVRVLDGEAREIFRAERIGGGVGTDLPTAYLDPEPHLWVPRALERLPRGAIAVSELELDSLRVEVPESDRQVLHLATRVDADQGPPGYLVVTAYAAPLLGRIRAFHPFPGVMAALLGPRGEYLASPDREREKGRTAGGNIADDHPLAADRVMAGEERVTTPRAVILASALGDRERPWRLVTLVPEAAFEAASMALRGQYAWTIGTMLAVSLALVGAGALFVRLSRREMALREEARYRQKQAELEGRLRLSERLGALGLLTAGVAHEINNPLEGIENYLALLERDSGPPEKRKRYVEMVRYGFHRIRDIVRDLSAFARPGVSSGAADLRAVIDQALKMVRYTKEMKLVRVEQRGFDAPLPVAGDAGRLEQVFINLFVNAARAMQGDGELTISGRIVEGGSAPREVEVTVEDSGPGIAEQDLPRLFDPFFTTGEGTGLGLSISFSIVSAHGGSIAAANRPAGGACFTLRFPAAQPSTLQPSTQSSSTA